MERKHTPGPWKCYTINDRILNHNRGFEIHGPETKGSIRDVLPTETEANAKLIAAAPDLLQALETAKHTLTQLNQNGIVDNTLLLIDRAIKKATD